MLLPQPKAKAQLINVQTKKDLQHELTSCEYALKVALQLLNQASQDNRANLASSSNPTIKVLPLLDQATQKLQLIIKSLN